MALATSNNYFIDGLYNNDRYYGDSAVGQTGIVGIPAILFPPEAIEELSVQETPSAEFGVKGGAPILLNMKSGTNAWHGSGTWVNHNGLGDAINYFGKSNGCGQPGECQATSIHNNQMNGTIGGPIIKDKAFLFCTTKDSVTNHLGLREIRAVNLRRERSLGGYRCQWPNGGPRWPSPAELLSHHRFREHTLPALRRSPASTVLARSSTTNSAPAVRLLCGTFSATASRARHLLRVCRQLPACQRICSTLSPRRASRCSA